MDQFTDNSIIMDQLSMMEHYPKQPPFAPIVPSTANMTYMNLLTSLLPQQIQSGPILMTDREIANSILLSNPEMSRPSSIVHEQFHLDMMSQQRSPTPTKHTETSQEPQAEEEHTIDKQGKPDCALCGLTFKRKADLRRHHICVHADIRMFHCPIGCGVSFSRRDALKRHLTQKGANKPCAGFRKTFKHRQNLS